MSHPKGVLMERAQKLGLGKPEFRTEQTGPEHEPRFLADVLMGGEVLGTGQGGTKRTAEKYAAEEALAALDARGGAGAKTKPKSNAKAEAKASSKSGGKSGGRSSGKQDGKPATTSGGKKGDAGAKRAEASEASEAAATRVANDGGSDDGDEGFDGPWPMFDDLLAAVVSVAERRVTSDLRGEVARTAIRDFSLDLYKDLLLGLGDIVEDEEEDED